MKTCLSNLGFSTQPPVETQRGGARQGRFAATNWGGRLLLRMSAQPSVPELTGNATPFSHCSTRWLRTREALVPDVAILWERNRRDATLASA